MIDKVNSVLKSINNPVPVNWNVRPEINANVNTAITFYFFSESDSIFGDGEGLQPGGSVQVSIFSTGDYTSTVNEVKAAMKAAGFRFADGWDSEESLPRKYYQKILIFNYIESEVIVNDLQN